MKKILVFILALFFLLLLVLYFSTRNRISTSELTNYVKQSIRENYDKNPLTQNIEIEEVALVHKGGNEYIGYVTVMFDDLKFKYDLEVFVDGESFLCRIKE